MFAVGQKRRYMGGDSGATGKWSEFSAKEERSRTDARSGNEGNNSEEYSLKIREVFPQVRSQGPENILPRKGVARQALRFVFHSRWALQTLERPVPGRKWGRKYVLLYGFCIAVLPGNSKLQKISSDSGKMNWHICWYLPMQKWHLLSNCASLEKMLLNPTTCCGHNHCCYQGASQSTNLMRRAHASECLWIQMQNKLSQIKGIPG